MEKARGLSFKPTRLPHAQAPSGAAEIVDAGVESERVQGFSCSARLSQAQEVGINHRPNSQNAKIKEIIGPTPRNSVKQHIKIVKIIPQSCKGRIKRKTKQNTTKQFPYP